MWQPDEPFQDKVLLELANIKANINILFEKNKEKPSTKAQKKLEILKGLKGCARRR